MLCTCVNILFVCLLAIPLLASCVISSAFYYYLIDVAICPQRIEPYVDVTLELDDILRRKKFTKSGIDNNLNSMASLNSYYRPRSALARALYEKQRNDRQLQEIDKNEWYRVEKSRLSSSLASKFVQLGPDRETKQFISDSIDKSSWIWTQIWYLLARLVLKYFWSVTDINGWLGRGSMFVLSEEQARTLLADSWDGTPAAPAAPAGSPASARRSLVDVGAGDGEVTRRWARLFPDRFATEVSASMRKLLAGKGFTLLDAERWSEGRQFDCVCMLNLLDRCSRPRSLLAAARAGAARGGVVLVALVLPYKPYVEASPDHKPEERMPITGTQFEEQVASFVEFMREEMSLELLRWTRVPYLCEGDVNQAYYWLDDSVYVFRPLESSLEHE